MLSFKRFGGQTDRCNDLLFCLRLEHLCFHLIMNLLRLFKLLSFTLFPTLEGCGCSCRFASFDLTIQWLLSNPYILALLLLSWLGPPTVLYCDFEKLLYNSAPSLGVPLVYPTRLFIRVHFSYSCLGRPLANLLRAAEDDFRFWASQSALYACVVYRVRHVELRLWFASSFFLLLRAGFLDRLHLHIFLFLLHRLLRSK